MVALKGLRASMPEVWFDSLRSLAGPIKEDRHRVARSSARRSVMIVYVFHRHCCSETQQAQQSSVSHHSLTAFDSNPASHYVRAFRQDHPAGRAGKVAQSVKHAGAKHQCRQP
jgi:hypothetical protein